MEYEVICDHDFLIRDHDFASLHEALKILRNGQ